MRQPNIPADPVAAGVKLITDDQRARCAAFAAILLSRIDACSSEQRALAETFRQGALLLQEIAS